MKKCMMIVMALVVLVVNPLVWTTGCGSGLYGCDPAPFNPTYTQGDLERELMAVPRVQRITLDDGSTMEVSLTVDAPNMQAIRQVVHPPGVQWVTSAYACDPVEQRISATFTGSLTITRTTSEGDMEVLVDDLELLPRHVRYDNGSEQLNVPMVLAINSPLNEKVDLGSGTTATFSLIYTTPEGRGAELDLTSAQVTLKRTNSDEVSFQSAD